MERFAHIFKEHAEYSDDYGDHPITEVVRDDHHEYAGVDGITYELGSGENMILGVDEIEATPENTFYDDQIDAYVKYIEDGGVLESFPVQPDPPMSRVEALEKLAGYDDDFDWADDAITDYGINFDFAYVNLANPPTKEASVVDYYDFMESLNDVFMDFFNEDFNAVVSTYKVGDYTWDDVFDDEEHEKDDVESFLNGLNIFITKVDEIRKDDTGVYTLTDMNHRFEAVKRMGVKRVWVEIV